MRSRELVEQKLCGQFLLEGHVKGRGHDRVHAELSTHCFATSPGYGSRSYRV
jgi:hypothetical protein